MGKHELARKLGIMTGYVTSGNWKKLAERLLHYLGKLGIAIHLDYLYLCEGPFPANIPPAGYRIRTGVARDIPRLAALRDADRDTEIFHRRLILGNTLQVTEYRGESIGYRWLARDRRHWPIERIVSFFPRATVYAYDAFISDPHRGKGLFGCMQARAFDGISDQGLRLGSYSDYFNESAHRAKDKSGEKKIALVLSFRLFSRVDWAICVRRVT